MQATRTARSAPIPPLRAGCCQVWWATSGAAAAPLLGLLDGDERVRHARLAHDRDRDLFLVAHALARVVAAHHAAVAPSAIRYAPTAANRKPRFSGPAAHLELSISHSGARAVVAISRDVAIGVDVEAVQAGGYEPMLVRSVLSRSEQDALLAMDEADRRWGFCRYWTRKEAVLKATGDGLGVSPELIVVTPPACAPELADWRAPGRPRAAVHLQDLDTGSGYEVSLASIGSALACTVHEANALLDEPR